MRIIETNLPRITGICLFPFIFVNDKTNKVLVNHEKIHYQQAKELLVIPFYIWYLLEWVFLMMIYWDWEKAYRNISFEQEAYANQANLNYLKERKLYPFLRKR
jgi:hypothetical protein